MTKTKPKKKRKAPHRSKRLPRGPHGGIELLLVQPVEHLGRQGEVVEVRPGYAHNYLLPQGLATIATEHHKRMVEKHREELAAVEAVIKRHPQSRNYRAAVKHNRIEIHELAGASGSDLAAVLTQAGFGTAGLADQMQDFQERFGRFTPVMRFILADAETRDFGVQRWCYRGSIDDWIDVGAFGPVDQVARQLIPTLGTDRFFELI